MLQEPLSPSLGIQAQLPVLLAEYTFRTRQDIEDYLQLLSLTDSYFRQILDFEQEKAVQGLFMSDASLCRIQEQCRSLISVFRIIISESIFSDKISAFPESDRPGEKRVSEPAPEFWKITFFPPIGF